MSVWDDPALDELPRPVAVWDVRDPGWFTRPGRHDWLKAHGLPSHKMYRAEFYAADAPFARIWCYALNDEGKRGWNEYHVPGPHDHSLCGAARERPCDVVLDELPPGELR